MRYHDHVAVTIETVISCYGLAMLRGSPKGFSIMLTFISPHAHTRGRIPTDEFVLKYREPL
jgi:hypothetical protein